MRWATPIAVTLGLVLAPAASGAQILVTTTADVAANHGACSLREAVIAARSNTNSGNCPGGDPAGTDEILVDAGTFEEATAAGALDTGAGAVRIAGLGSVQTIIDANGIDRAFDVPVGGSLILEDLTVREGRPGAESSAPGGAVSTPAR